MYGGEGMTPRLPLACVLGGGTLASILWLWPGFLFRCPHTWRRPHWWCLALLRPLGSAGVQRAPLLTAARCANGSGGIKIGHASWRKKAIGLQMRLLGVNGERPHCSYLSH
jgi:hypothetical protein